MGASTGRILTGGGIGGPGGNNSDLVMLNINQRVTAVATGKLDPDVDRDYLLVGTPTNLLVYDVEKNADIFHKVERNEDKRRRTGDSLVSVTQIKIIAGRGRRSECHLCGIPRQWEGV